VNAAAVIGRELRAQSRQTVNYWLRVLAGAVGILIFAGLLLGSQVPLAQLGPLLFSVLHRTLFLFLFVVVPLLTADTVSREKREGTLGLLFLTPLTALDVILGKGAVHIIRALSVFFAAAPVLGLPFVFGGVGWATAFVAAVEETGAVLLGIGAGLYASTKGGTTIQVMVRALAYALVLAIIWVVCGLVVGTIIEASGFLTGRSLAAGFFLYSFGRLISCLTVFWLVLRASTHRLKGTWQEEAAAPEQPRWVQLFSDSEFWQEAFRWDRSRARDQNPVAWLQEYSWTARLTKWGWFLLMLTAEILALSNWDDQRFAGWQPWLTATLALGIAFSTAGSFRRERQEGLLELLLVTPLSVRQVLGGRFWGICCHYLPAAAVLLVGWSGDRLLNPRLYQADVANLIFPNPIAFCTLVVTGLYLSLKRLNFLLGSALTWVTSFLVPVLMSLVLVRAAHWSTDSASVVVSAGQVPLVVFFWFLLHRNLTCRSFL
jgi:ABC-type Na+ efflux pump permease subunit